MDYYSIVIYNLIQSLTFINLNKIVKILKYEKINLFFYFKTKNLNEIWIKNKILREEIDKRSKEISNPANENKNK